MSTAEIDPIRLNMREKFRELCEKYIHIRELDSETLAKRIERSCYNKTVDHCRNAKIIRNFHVPEFTNWYSMLCYRLLSNFDPTSIVNSTHLCDMLNRENINIAHIADLESSELCPEASHKERAIIEQRRQSNLVVKISNAYTCKKCGEKKTNHMEYQARASDESSTFSVECIHCGYIWRC